MVDLIRQEQRWDRQVLRRIETPAASATDDVTSHIAADIHTASGKRHSNMATVVELVRMFPGCTSAELGNATTLTRHEVARRLPEAITAGAVKKGVKRRCNANGSLATTWWPV